MHPLLDAYLATIAAPTSRRAARADLLGLLQWWADRYQRPADPTQLMAKDVTAWRSYRQTTEERTVSTINRGLSSVRRFAQWLCTEGHLRENPTAEVRDLPTEQRGPRALADDAVDALIRAVQAEEHDQDLTPHLR